ncbi:MAG: transporter substrate-binding domain-containing protein [Proteobacteria bacterium]|nr:transporter substrate-binding domain-containing protein [Pseudomonadota bacterium]
MKKLIFTILSFIILSFRSFGYGQQPIRVVTALYEPFVYYDENRKLTGFDIDLLKKICERINISYSIEVVSFPEILNKISKGEADIAIGAIYVTDERKKIVSFTDHYLETGLVFVIKAGDIFSKDLSNKTIGVKKRATGEVLAQKYSQKFINCKVVSFNSTEESINALIDKKVDVVLNDFLNTNWLMFKKYRGSIVIPRNFLDLPVSLTKDKIAFPVNKNRADLLEKFNDALRQLKQEGYIAQLLKANPYIPHYPNLIRRIIIGAGFLFLLLGVIILVDRNFKNKERLKLLMAEERKLKNILNGFPNLILFHNSKGEIIYLNEKSQEFGVKERENLFEFFNKRIIKKEDKDLIRKRYEKLFKDNKSLEITNISATDEKNVFKIWEIRATTVEDYNKKLYLTFIQDETYIKDMEKQIFQMQKLDSVGRLTAGIAHDFNNSLSAILGYIQLAKLKIDNKEDVSKSLDKAIYAVDRASGMVKKLLAFTKAQAIQPQILNINNFILNTKEVMEKLVGEDINIEINLQQELLNIKIDPTQFEQVLINLIVNARDAMPKGGKITITTKNVFISEESPSLEIGEYVLMVVSDTGTGMSEEVKSKVFDPFFTTKEKGTGLGLSTVYGIIRQNRGDISISSELGSGTSISIYLPAVRDEANEEKKEAHPKIEVKPRHLILLVEDDSMIRESVVLMLKELGYDVLTAENGKEGLEVYRKNKNISVVITDIIMPEMSGIDMINEMCKINSSLKCLFMTGYSDAYFEGKIELSSNKNIINKPFTINILLEKMNSLLNN